MRLYGGEVRWLLRAPRASWHALTRDREKTTFAMRLHAWQGANIVHDMGRAFRKVLAKSGKTPAQVRMAACKPSEVTRPDATTIFVKHEFPDGPVVTITSGAARGREFRVHRETAPGCYEGEWLP
jgi:hypothetical protein